ncbi:hypothetical protein PS874_01539 [Pseudomonas fluorescens]|nr:hypothetical protein PS874_01539 [Pseudomonas fluorescens]
MTEQNLLAQLQRLSDMEDIRALRHRYAYLANVVDGVPGDQEAFAELFTESGTFDVGMGLATGREAIEAMLRALAVDWVCAMHYMLNPLIELQGERAPSRGCSPSLPGASRGRSGCRTSTTTSMCAPTRTGASSLSGCEPLPPIRRCSRPTPRSLRQRLAWRRLSLRIGKRGIRALGTVSRPL